MKNSFSTKTNILDNILKYELFKNIPGNQNNKIKLQKLLDSNIKPNGLLFSGQYGIGKFAFAIDIARYLNVYTSENPQKTIGLVNQFVKPYVNYVFPIPNKQSDDDGDKKNIPENILKLIKTQITKKSENPFHPIYFKEKTNISIDIIRDLKKDLSITRNENGTNVIIIDYAEQMSIEAQNSLLKILEEPPESTLFIILVEDKNQIVSTILSRCWVFDFNPLMEEEVFSVLTNNFQIEPEKANSVIPFAHGSYVSAIDLLQLKNIDLSDLLTNFFRFAITKKYFTAFNYLSQIYENVNEKLDFVIYLLKIWLNDAEKNMLNFDQYTFSNLNETYSKMNSSQTKYNFYLVQQNLDKYFSYTKTNINSKILFMNLIFEISTISNR